MDDATHDGTASWNDIWSAPGLQARFQIIVEQDPYQVLDKILAPTVLFGDPFSDAESGSDVSFAGSICDPIFRHGFWTRNLRRQL